MRELDEDIDLVFCNGCSMRVEAEVRRSGDSYAPDTRFWIVCPLCGDALEEEETGE
jgi:hypothetical protein